MKTSVNYIYKVKEKFEINVNYFIFSHPVWSHILIFIGMPILIIIAVFISTAIISLPFAWLFGWL